MSRSGSAKPSGRISAAFTSVKIALFAPIPNASVRMVIRVNAGAFTSARSAVTQIEEQGSHEGFSRRNDGSADTRGSRPLGGGVRSGERHGAKEIGQRTAPGERRSARARHLQKIDFQVGGEALTELARVRAQEQSICGRRESMLAHGHDSRGTSRFARSSAARRESRRASSCSAARPAGCSANVRRRSLRAAGSSLHEAARFEPLERAVDRARPHRRARRLFDRLHDGVAVQRPFGERKEDVEDSRGQRYGRHITVTEIYIRHCNNASGRPVSSRRSAVAGQRAN